MKKTFESCTINNRKPQNLLSKFLVLLFSVFVGLFGLSCIPTASKINQNRNIVKKLKDYNKTDFRQEGLWKINDVEVAKLKSEQKIKYLAIGDSVSQGFYMIPFVSLPGKMNQQRVVEGGSWPAFLARFIQKLQPDKLESFWNLALSGTTLYDWNYFLDPRNFKYKHAKKNADAQIVINREVAKNKYQNFEKQMAEHFNFEDPKPFEKLIQKVREANLITITLGINSVVSFNYNLFTEMFGELKKHGFTSLPKNAIRDIVEKYKKRIEEFYLEVKEAYSDLIYRIKVLNPDASIVIVSHPMTQYEIFSNIMHILWNIDENFYSRLFNRHAENLKEIAILNKVSYVNTSTQSWSNFSKFEYIGSILDFHPTIKGQKWIAQQVLLKLAMPADKIDQYHQEFSIDKRLDWLKVDDRIYADSDRGQFRKEIYLSEENEQKIYWFTHYKTQEEEPLEASIRPWMSKHPDLPEMINFVLERTSLNYLAKTLPSILLLSGKAKSPPVGSFVSSNFTSLFKGFGNYVTEKWNSLKEKPLWNKKFTRIIELAYMLLEKFLNEFRGSVNIVLLLTPTLTKVMSSEENYKLYLELFNEIRTLPFLFISEINDILR